MKPTTRLALALLLGGAALSGSLVSSRAQAPAPAEEKKDQWETSAAAGVTVTKGNSDTLLFTANILSARKWNQNEMRLGADGSYGENEDIKNTESLHGFAQYNRLFTERAYGYLRFDALHDAVADVEYRLTLSPGAGYYFIKTAQTTLSGEAGPGFIYEKQGNDETGYVTIRLAERFEHKLNARVRIWQSIEFLPQVDDFDNFLINAEIGVDTGLTEKLFLSVFAVDTYDNQPAPGRDENDVKLVAALKYKF